MKADPYSQRRLRKIGPHIDLGCGPKCRAGFIGIDLKDHGQDIVWDVREGIPLPDNSVEHLFTSHFVEHVTDEDWLDLWKEVVRICKHKAKIEIRCPHSDSTESMYSSHLSLWNQKRLLGVCLGYTVNEKSPKKLTLISYEKVGIELQAVVVVEVK